MRPRWWFAALIASVLTLVFVQSVSFRRTSHVKIRLKWTHQAQFAGFYAAVKQGYFQKRHLDVILEPSTADAPAIQMVASGADEFGIAVAGDLILARSNGLPVKAVAVLFQDNPFCYMVREGAGISSVRDLQGKRVGIEPNNQEMVTLRAMLANAHMQETDVVRQQVEGGELVEKFIKDKSIDAWPSYSINEPHLLKKKYNLNVGCLMASDYGARTYGDTLFTSEKLIEERGPLVKDVVAAVREGWQYALLHPNDAVDYAIEFSRDGKAPQDQSVSLDPDLQLLMLQDIKDKLVVDPNCIGSMDGQRWTDIFNILSNGNLVGDNPDFRKAYEDRFIKELVTPNCLKNRD